VSGGSTVSTTSHERANDSVSARFTRVMNASTSRYGILTDPPIIAALTIIGVVALIVARDRAVSSAMLRIFTGLALLPTAIAVITWILLMGARRRLVDWLAGLPFPLENMNSVLNGVGELLEISFTDPCPAEAELNAELEKTSEDSFVIKVDPEQHTIEVRIGVVDSKRNPAGSNHRRFVRVRELVQDVLIPLHARYPISEVRVK
jgi:hypothetical protein